MLLEQILSVAREEQTTGDFVVSVFMSVLFAIKLWCSDCLNS